MGKLSGVLQRYLAKGLGADGKFRLVGLWRNWDDVMGPLAPLMRPLGHKKRTLMVGALTPLDLQEITYYAPQIVTNANAFLGEEFFDKVQANLLMDRTSLDAVRVDRPRTGQTGIPTAGQVGKASDRMEPESPVTKCYNAYVRLVNGRGR